MGHKSLKAAGIPLVGNSAGWLAAGKMVEVSVVAGNCSRAARWNSPPWAVDNCSQPLLLGMAQDGIHWVMAQLQLVCNTPSLVQPGFAVEMSSSAAWRAEEQEENHNYYYHQFHLPGSKMDSWTGQEVLGVDTQQELAQALVV